MGPGLPSPTPAFLVPWRRRIAWERGQEWRRGQSKERDCYLLGVSMGQPPFLTTAAIPFSHARARTRTHEHAIPLPAETHTLPWWNPSSRLSVGCSDLQHLTAGSLLWFSAMGSLCLGFRVHPCPVGPPPIFTDSWNCLLTRSPRATQPSTPRAPLHLLSSHRNPTCSPRASRALSSSRLPQRPDFGDFDFLQTPETLG